MQPPVISPISWIFGTPVGTTVNSAASGTNAWWTGYNQTANAQPTYFNLESSVVNGPCFDLSNLQRPMMSFDYWSDAERNLDGAVVQYSTDGGLSWRLVGPSVGLSGTQRDQGINWYDPFAIIVSDPGQQVKKYFSPASYGWTDKSTGWKNARFNLDMVPSLPLGTRTQVRLRIAFSSNDQNAPGNTFDGFAFDNVIVGEKERHVLVEHFTNSSSPASVAGDAWVNARYQDQLINRGPLASDFYDIQYHINIPGTDPLNLENPNDPASRAVFFGVTNASTTVIDGILDGVKFKGLYTDLDLSGVEADRRALVDPQFDLLLDTISTGINNTITVRLTMTCRTPVTVPLIAHVALVENQTGTFKKVLRKQLFGPDGRTITQQFLVPGIDSRVETASDVVIDVPTTNPSQLTLVGYVQNKNTREIYQSAVVQSPYKKGSLVTGLEGHKTLPTTLNGISIYPNPANGKVFFGTPSDQSMEGFTWKLIDQRGVTVGSGNFDDLINGTKEVAVSDLANGIYFVQLAGPGQSVVHRKLVVMNRN